MRKNELLIFTFLLSLAIMLPAISSQAQPQGDTHSCVMMKFVNKTRFTDLEPEVKLSDLVMEKLVASGKVYLKETRPIESKISEELYDENYRSAQIVNEAEKGNFNALFESNQAASLSEAHKGQVISPELTSVIGKNHGAEYLIQGTILSISRGQSIDNDVALASGIGGVFSGGLLGELFRNTSKVYSGFNIMTDLRVIKAETGEVIWSKMLTSVSKQEKTDVGALSMGSDELSMNLYEMALDQAAQKMVDELIADMDGGFLVMSN